MKYILIALTLCVAGCSTAPVKHAMPSMPNELSVACEALQPVNENEQKLSELLKVVNHNYGLYYDCMIKHESIIDWYNKQKKIHDDVHN